MQGFFSLARTLAALAFALAFGEASSVRADVHRWAEWDSTTASRSHPRVRLGFTGKDCGYGVEVLGVNHGTTADRLWLECGDMVVGVNGLFIP